MSIKDGEACGRDNQGRYASSYAESCWCAVFAPKPQKGHPRESLPDRLERAAAALNPTLALIAIGLVILNILVAFSLVIPFGRIYPGAASPACAAGSAAAQPR
jgi:hypothetical protein